MKKSITRNFTRRILNYKSIILNVFGIFYILIASVAFFNAIFIFEDISPLWFSYFAFLFVGIGILFRNSYLVGSQINIIFFPYLVWSIDFFYILISSNSLWGITDYFFASNNLMSQIITIQHVFIIPISLIAVFWIGLKRKDFWKFSLCQGVFLFVVSKFFTPINENINCVFESCVPLKFEFLPYELVWWIIFLVMVFLTNFLLLKSFNYFKKT